MFIGSVIALSVSLVLILGVISWIVIHRIRANRQRDKDLEIERGGGVPGGQGGSRVSGMSGVVRPSGPQSVAVHAFSGRGSRLGASPGNGQVIPGAIVPPDPANCPRVVGSPSLSPAVASNMV